MLKPVTKDEKIEFTLRVQADKAKDEILWQLLDEKYNGFVDIWAEIYKKKGKLVLEVKHAKIKTSDETLTNKNSVRYHILPGKGVKIINQSK